MKQYHPSHDLEWRDSSHYDYVCKKCDIADTPSGLGKLAEPCGTFLTQPIGSNPLPKDAQEKLAEFLEWLDTKYEVDNGVTALFWGLSYEIGNRLVKK